MSDAPPKAKYRWIVMIWGLALVLAVGWSAWWFYGAHRIGAWMDDEAVALRSAGYAVSWKDRHVGGFPFRFYITADDVQVDEPQGWGFSTGRLEAESAVLFPDVLVLVAPKGLVLHRPGAPAVTVTGQVLRASLGGIGAGAPARLRLQGLNLNLSSANDTALPFATMAGFEARLTPDDENNADVYLHIENATPTPDTLLGRIAGAAPVTIGLDASASHADALSGASLAAILNRWTAAGGQMSVHQGGIVAGGDLIDLKPTILGVDGSGQLTGELAFKVSQPALGLLALGELGVLPPDTAAVAAGVTAAQSAVTTGSGFEARLHFHDAQTWIGPLPVGPAPRLYRPAS